jgi:uncharacterized protein (DUF433 family)
MQEIAPGVTVDPKVRSGKPVIRGTRVPVDLVVGTLAGAMTQEEVAEEHGITREDVLAALAYAARGKPGSAQSARPHSAQPAQ